MTTIMTLLRVIFVVILCLPFAYLLLYLSVKLIDIYKIYMIKVKKEAEIKKRKKKNEKRSIYYNGRP